MKIRDDHISLKIHEMTQQEEFRQRILQIIIEHENSVPFMERVREYANTQIDHRLFKFIRAIIVPLAGLACAALLDMLLT